MIQMSRVAAALALALLSGCSALHWYDKSADTLATSIQSGYRDSKIVDAIQREQADLDLLDSRGVEAQLKLLTARRDLELLALLEEAPQPFVQRFDDALKRRLAEILGGAMDRAAALSLVGGYNAALDVQAGRQKVEASQRGNFPPVLAKLPPCTEANAALYAAATPENLRTALKSPTLDTSALLGPFKQYVEQACGPLLAAQRKLKEAFAGTGELALAQAQADRLDTGKKQADSALAEAKAALKKAADAAAQAQATVAQAGQPVDRSCKSAKDGAPPHGICAALADLARLDELGKQASSEEKLKSIGLVLQKINLEQKIKDGNGLLAALSGTASDPAAENGDPQTLSALALLATSERFAAAVDEYRSAGTLPALEPLLIEKQLEQARLAYATRFVDLQQARIALAHEKVDALLQEVDLLLLAQGGLGAIRPPPQGCRKQPDSAYCASASAMFEPARLRRLSTAGGEPAARSVYRSLQYFMDSYSVARARSESADMKLVVSYYRDAFISSEAALSYWDALIATPLAQLQAYHAGGLKPEEIAQFLQAAGVVGIALK